MEDADDRWLERLGLDPEGAQQDVQQPGRGRRNEKKDLTRGKHAGSPEPGEPIG